jgi:hypothetical protein
MSTTEEKTIQLLDLPKNLEKVGFTAYFVSSEKGLVLIVNKKKSRRLKDLFK